ncbi:MAG: hypothetical protein DRG39_00280 [Deltaproteobacteria bacterium]|nr:MAG: hypothetical protein DRG39_00280 [Deltaproteobacteria bacterium]
MTSAWFIFINLFLLVSIMLSGCGPVKSGAKRVSEAGIDTLNIAKYKILPKKDGPKKRVLIIPFTCAWEPLSGYGEKVSVRFARELKRLPGNILVYLPENPSAWKVSGPMPRFGIINLPGLIKDASKLNMNYLVTGIMDVMKAERRVNGVWPFRHFDQVFEAVMVINVIDTVTGALVESNMESAEFAIPLKKMPKDQNKLFVKVLKQTMPSLLRRQTRLVAKVLQKDIWKARILEVYNNPGKVKIGAGKDVGIKEGMLLKVFEWGKRINSPYASSFHCLGKKIGEIKIVSVKEHYSIAVPLNKADYRPGLPVVFD